MKGEETVTLLRDSPGGVDKYDDPVNSTPERIDIPGCLVAPRESHEPTERGGSGVFIRWEIYAPPGTAARHTDRVEVRGEPCRIEGDIADWDPKGVVINAVRTEGAPS